jgi:hypothetical protein
MEERGAMNTALYIRLFRDVREKMEAGTAKPCISSLLWEAGPSPELTEVEMAYFTAMPFAAGTTTVRNLLRLMTGPDIFADFRIIGAISS